MLDLLVNGESFFEITSFKKREKLYEKALDLLDYEINEIAEYSKNLKYGAFLWCYTYDIHRVDGVAHTVLHYYIFEILRDIKSVNQNVFVSVEVSLPIYFIEIIKSIINVPVANRVPLRQRVRIWVRYQFGPLQRLYKQKLLLSNHEHSKKESGGSLILYDIDSDFTRLKDFPSYLEKRDEKVKILDHSLKCVKNFDSTEKTPVKSRIKIGELYNFIKQSWCIKKSIKYLKAHLANESTFVHVLSNQTLLQSFFMLVKEKSFYLTFKELKPSKVYVSTTFGDPVKRMAISVADKMGIETSVISCRPFITRMRSEDRLIRADILEFNQTSVGKSFYVFDSMSQKHLVASGYRGKIISYEFDDANVDCSYNENCKDGLLLLFAGFYLNRGLMKMVDQIKSKGLLFPVIYYREHPLVKISEKERLKLESIAQSVVCLTGKKWSNINFKNVLAITCNTTASIDAVQRGCSLLWLPFISEQSLQFSEIMNSVGDKSENYQDAIGKVTEFLADLKK